jgi:rubrerythrin
VGGCASQFIRWRLTRVNLQAADAGGTHEYTDMYPGMAKTAREQGFDEIANWFETLKTHA